MEKDSFLSQKLNRRTFLQISALTSSAIALSACIPKANAQEIPVAMNSVDITCNGSASTAEARDFANTVELLEDTKSLEDIRALIQESCTGIMETQNPPGTPMPGTE